MLYLEDLLFMKSHEYNSCTSPKLNGNLLFMYSSKRDYVGSLWIMSWKFSFPILIKIVLKAVIFEIFNKLC